MLYTIIFIILFFIFLTFIYSQSNWSTLNKTIYNNNFVIISHRGNHKKYYENTQLAFNSALNYQIDGIELDVQKTADNKLIVFHDFNLSRLKKPHQLIKHTNWDEIKNYQLGENENETIPLLKDVFKSIGMKTILNIEIKSNNLFNVSIAKEVVELAKKYNVLQQCIISSFNPLIIKKIKNNYPQVITAWIWSKKNSYKILRSLIWLNIIKPDFFHADINSLNPIIVKKIKKYKLKIIAYTVNSESEYYKCKKNNLDGIITDDLEKYSSKI